MNERTLRTIILLSTMVFRLDIAKLFPNKIEQKINQIWRSPFVQKEELSKPVIRVIRVRWGKTSHSPLLCFLASSAPSLPGPQPPIVPTPVPAPSNPEGDLMIYD